MAARRHRRIIGAAGDFLGDTKEYFLFVFDNTRPGAGREPVENHAVHWLNRRMGRRHSVGACALLAVAWAMAAGVSHSQAAGGPAASTPVASAAATRSGGIWKAAVPPKPMRGEFDSLDPLGVAAGAKIKADCSLNWINPDDDKLYCFSSGTSLEIFLDRPHANLERARVVWRRLAAQQK
jgi:hypothetical protein